ncbi:hypothetical protein ISS08_00655 [Candidatus Pacearchaeota archaeon]|nr:hypothetical protein [Candidatus Pacearchaeota archaeon]
MRKIATKKEELKKQKRNQVIIGSILILIMFSSVIGYGFQTSSTESPSSSQSTYNGFEFLNQNDIWYLTINDVNFAFRYHPTQVGQTNMSLNTLNEYYQKPLYIQSFNAEAEAEVYLNLGQLTLRTQKACFEQCDDENSTLPIKTCQDNFILIEESEINEVVQEDNCVFIRGSEENILKTIDSFLFRVLGIENI